MKGDNEYAICLTTVVSHLAIVPALWQLIKRRWIYEVAISIFAVFVSFMYHLCQAFGMRFFLSELQWHRLDNIGALGCFGAFFTHLCCFRDPNLDSSVKFLTLFLSIIVQEHSPWNEMFTFVPILSFALLPVVIHVFQRKRPLYDMRSFVYGFGGLAAAVPFFVAGLDDDNDPWRMYHGMWHVLGGLSSFYLWRVVRTHPLHPADRLVYP